MKRWVKRVVWGALAIGGLSLLVWAFVPKPVEVDIAHVDRGLLQVVVEEEGKTRIRERYVISAPLEGQLQRVELEAGDPVEAGKTVLAMIEPRDPALLNMRSRAEASSRVDAARARLEQTGPMTERMKAELQIARAELSRLRELPAGNVSRKELDDALLLVEARIEALRASQIAQDIAAYELKVAQAALMRVNPSTTLPSSAAADWTLRLVSPISGKVLRLIRESAMPVVAGAEIMEVGDPGSLEVEMETLSTEAVKVEPGDRVQFVRWGGGAPINGVVRLIEPQAFTKISALGVEEQRVRIISDLTDPPQQYASLGDWFRVDGRIIVWEDPNALIVPTSALFRQGQQWRVFVIESDRAAVREVTIGQTNGLLAEVLGGLKQGDVVIVHPSDQVVAGVRVQRREGSAEQ